MREIVILKKSHYCDMCGCGEKIERHQYAYRERKGYRVGGKLYYETIKYCTKHIDKGA